jgi:hypothetical protein
MVPDPSVAISAKPYSRAHLRQTSCYRRSPERRTCSYWQEQSDLPRDSKTFGTIRRAVAQRANPVTSDGPSRSSLHR